VLVRLLDRTRVFSYPERRSRVLEDARGGLGDLLAGR
jgi:hypothetical protein